MSQRDSVSSNGGSGIEPPTAGSAAAEDTGPFLSPADAAAVDALLQAGWNPQAVPLEHRQRAQQLDALLATLIPESAITHEEALEDVVLLRISRLRDTSACAGLNGAGHGLCPDDARVLDALVADGWSTDAVEPADAPRASRQLALLSVIDPGPAAITGREDRIARTLSGVQQTIEAQEQRLQFIDPPATPGGRRGLQLADLISIAALLLIGTALVWPLLESTRQYNRRAACQAGMLTAGLGLGQYAASNRDQFPMASDSLAGNPWWDVGRPERSNSANLFTLVRTGHVQVQSLACDGNPAAARSPDQAGPMDWRRFPDVSYSYRLMFGRRSTQVTDRAQAIVLADRSTLILLRPGQLELRPLENSPNHRGQGQSILLADGSVQWLTSPILSDGDNIWLPRPLEQVIARLQGTTGSERLEGVETPEGLADEFVAP